ncbi:cyclase family protein [Gluconacetobacter sp. Hr-1-5]|uniref:cyclase family protein n=1 Tax=Gluconacetobacter sp. Hr-1-5 TaxID=3395370 RepID=UPI003B521A89
MTILQQLAKAIAEAAIEVVDLTHTLSEDFPTLLLPEPFGQTAAFSTELISRYDERGVAWYWRNFTVGEHTGTHFDAPAHWITGRDLAENTVDTIPPARFVAAACVIDCAPQAAENPDFLLSVADIAVWEDQHGRIPARSWVLMRTDWGRRTGDAYANRAADGAHTPGPSAEAIRFLIEERDILGFGTETIGTDAGQGGTLTPPYPAHTLLHAAGRYGLQCLTALDRLPPTGAVVLAAPLKLRDGSGSPLRVLALVER